MSGTDKKSEPERRAASAAAKLFKRFYKIIASGWAGQLTAIEARTFLVFLAHADSTTCRAHPSLRKVARLINTTSVSRVRSACRSLSKKGLLVVVAKGKRGRGLKATNRREIRVPRESVVSVLEGFKLNPSNPNVERGSICAREGFNLRARGVQSVLDEGFNLNPRTPQGTPHRTPQGTTSPDAARPGVIADAAASSTSGRRHHKASIESTSGTKRHKASPNGTATGAPDKRAPSAPSPSREVEAHFCAQWADAFGRKYAFQGGKDGAATGRILSACGMTKGDESTWASAVAEAKALIDAYLADPDPFIVKQGYTLAFFSTKINAYRVQSSGVRRAAGEPMTELDRMPETTDEQLALIDQGERELAEERRRRNGKGAAS